MKKPARLIRLAGIIILLGPLHSISGELIPFKISLEERLAIGGIESDDLCMWSGIAVDGSGRVFVTDMMEHTLKSFAPDGRRIKTVGRKGQGPGEFSGPLALTRAGDRLYVLEQNRRGIQVFDLDLNYIRLLPCMLPLMRLEASPRGGLSGFPLTAGGEGKLIFLDKDGRSIRDFAFSKKPLGLMMDQISYAFTSSGDVILVFNYRDRIERFTSEGRKVFSCSLKGGFESRKRPIHGGEFPVDLVHRGVALDSRDRVYVLSGDLAEFPARDINVLNLDGEPIASFTLPDTTHLLYFDSEDFLYVRADSGVTIKKYRIHIKSAGIGRGRGE